MIHGYRITMLVLAVLCIFSACNFPYDPKTEEPVTKTTTITNQSGVIVIKVVPGMQICNPSMSLDTVNFPASMLWLNFAGTIPVKTDQQTSGYPKAASQHDRLTITDTSNTVRWYLLRDSLTTDFKIQFQDPEWSAHPEYIGTLLGNVNNTKMWSFYVVHPATNHILKLIDKKLDDKSAPHLWVDRSVAHPSPSNLDTSYDIHGILNRAAVASFFGTSKVKLVYSQTEGSVQTLYYIDFNKDTIVPVRILRSREQFNESALISPDGDWIVFNGFNISTNYNSYIQKLSPQSTPILLKEGASDPHWWLDPASNQYYIIYSKINGDNRVYSDLSQPRYLTTGESGQTYLQKINLSPHLPAALSIETGIPNLLVNLPLKGGLSPDGHILCTGYNFAYFVELR